MKVNFFCGGPIKSGTTLLQRALDSHPDISCEPEHYFKLLLQDLLVLCNKYNANLEVIANTIGIAPRKVEQYFFLEAFYKIIEEIFDRANEKNNFCGINDNSFIKNNGEALLKKFTDHRIIYIIRNPLDTALSVWDHWFRDYKKNNDITKLKWLQTDGKFDKDQFVIRSAKKWNEHAKYMINMLEIFPNRVLIVRYEDFTKEKEKNLEKILNFLGANSNEIILKKISQESTLEKMRNDSTNPDFYKKARKDFGVSVLNKKIIQKSIDECSESFTYFDYQNLMKESMLSCRAEN